jgi:hypothetical protein
MFICQLLFGGPCRNRTHTFYFVLINKHMKICPKCNTEHNKPGTYCSRKCANSRIFSSESKLKTASTLKRKFSTGELVSHINPAPLRISEYPYTRLYGSYSCHHCNKVFWQLKYSQKCCSIECRDSIRSQNKCRKTHISYFNKHEDKTVDLQSTWELEIAKWLDSNNIVWIRPSQRIKWQCADSKTNKTYLPDFYLVDYCQYIDVKNPIKMAEDSAKLKQLQSIIPLAVGDIAFVKSFVERLAGLEPACIH